MKQNLDTLTTVYMIDEHPVFQLGLQRLLRRSHDFTVIGFGTSLRELELSRKTPDIIIIDFVVDRSRGIGIIRDLKRYCPTAYVLVLTTQDESLFAERCLRAGAQGYVMKSSPNSDYLDALIKISEGNLYLSAPMKERMISRLTGGGDRRGGLDTFDRLSDRELLIVQHIGESKGNREIARELKISVKTIESHRSRIKTKLGFSTPNELVRFAMSLQSRPL